MKPVTRRRVLIGGAAALATLAGARSATAQASPSTAGPGDPKLIEDLVAANRILADQGVVDGYGHVSVRHDKAADSSTARSTARGPTCSQSSTTTRHPSFPSA